MTLPTSRDRRRVLGTITALVLLAAWLVGLGARHPAAAGQQPASAAARLVPERSRVAGMPPELRERVAATPMAFFRFVNAAWTREVCEAFRIETRQLPTARLHGDAHVEQYAVTATARGLDDFDDSARGPAVIDLVRFLGSLELAAAQRGWAGALPATIDAFFDGYRRALEDPSYTPPDPAVVKRLRGAPQKSPSAFLSWADSLMQPLTANDQANLHTTWARVVASASRTAPEFTRAFMTLKRVGWLRTGIGSALTRKLLIRVEGPSPALDDDVVLEAKQVGAFQSDSCVSVPRRSEAFRVVEGIKQIGRLQPSFVVALPGIEDSRPDTPDWWAKTWDRSYQEVEIAALDSPEDLQELARDAGAQLGSTNLPERTGGPEGQNRLIELQAIVRLESRIRDLAHDLTTALLQAWKEFRVSS